MQLKYVHVIQAWLGPFNTSVWLDSNLIAFIKNQDSLYMYNLCRKISGSQLVLRC